MKKLASFVAATAFVLTALTGTVHAAGSATLTVSGGTTVTKGNNVSVSVVENGSNVNVVTAKLTYDASKLTCNGVSGGAYNNVSASCGNGTVTISRYADADANPAGVTGNWNMGTVSFTAIAAGSAAVSTAAGTQIASNGSNAWNGVTSTTSFTINNPAPVDPGKGGGTPPVVNPSTTPAPQPGAAKTTPTGEVKGNGTVATATTTTGNEASESTPVTTSTTDDQKSDNKDDQKSDDNKAADSKDAKDTTSSGWFWLIALLAVIAGFVAARRFAAARAAKAQEAAAVAEAAAAVVATKKAAKKAKKN